MEERIVEIYQKNPQIVESVEISFNEGILKISKGLLGKIQEVIYEKDIPDDSLMYTIKSVIDGNYNRRYIIGNTENINMHSTFFDKINLEFPEGGEDYFYLDLYFLCN